jgi:hypothetical protein
VRVLAMLGSAAVSLALVAWLTRRADPGDPFASRPGFAEQFFSAQARAMVRGALDVPTTALPGECYQVGDLCYGYYGVTPSLLRLPLLAVHAMTGPGLPGLTSVMLAIAVLVGVVAGLLLVDQAWRTAVPPRLGTGADRPWAATGAYLVAVVAVGPGSLLLQDLRPRVFEEAIAWSASLAVVGLLFVLRWLANARPVELVAATAAFVLSANARPTGGVTALAVGAVGLLVVARDRTRGARHAGPGQVWALVALTVLPLLTALLVFRLKFDAWVPDLTWNEQIPEQPWWAQILAANGGATFSPAFAPTSLWAYLRPVPGSFAWLPPLEPGTMFVEPTSSATGLAPLALALLVLALAIPPLLGRARSAWSTRLLLLASFAGLLVTLTAVSVTHRYLGDAVPGLTLAVALGSVSLAAVLGRLRTPAAVLVLTAAILLAAYGVVASVVTAAGMR